MHNVPNKKGKRKTKILEDSEVTTVLQAIDVD